ncbi:MAG: ferric reductase-like transmembrane domain-containing protein [Cyanobacteriota bacterium]|nr:ferric reductase-like transmembrane domain-containing protein [Cyanobacteriota bacterium]
MILDTAPLANYLGLFALISYILTLLPTILRIVFPATKKTELPKFLLKYRRQIGVIAFLFAFAHGILLLSKRNFDVFDFQTYSIYATGVVTLIVFALLAITSNDWSIKKMKKNWKKLHQLTYFAMFILVWHVIYTMWGHWSHITPLGVIGITGITILFIARKLIERNKKSVKIKAGN